MDVMYVGIAGENACAGRAKVRSKSLMHIHVQYAENAAIRRTGAFFGRGKFVELQGLCPGV